MEDMVSSGVVLTGGTALMPGIVELAEEVFGKPARVGVPDYKGHLHEIVHSPRYSTAVGLLMEGRSQVVRGHRAVQAGTVQSLMARMREWFTGNF